MQTAALPASSPTPGIALPAWAPAIGLLLLLIALNPVGYVGGGSDDWHYVQAGLCAAEHGACAPVSHWWTRWPIVLPLGWSFTLFGVSATAAGIAPLVYAIGALVLLGITVASLWGRRAALLSTLVFAATPVVFDRAMQPSVDLVELFWVLAALALLIAAARRGDGGRVLAAGACLGLAVLSRPTALALLPVAGLGLLLLPAARNLPVPRLAAGFAAILLSEALFQWWLTGDPATGWHLSVGHTRLPSTELAGGVDVTRSPILNLDMIRGWTRASGIALHWTIDPVVNLLAHPAINITLLGAMLLAALVRADGRMCEAQADRALATVAGGAILHLLLLSFVLAVDPKPRMFLPLAAAGAVTIGVLADRLAFRPVTATLFLLLGVRAITSAWAPVPVARLAEPTIAAWVDGAGGRARMDETTTRLLAFSPARTRLRPDLPASILISIDAGRCAAAQDGQWRLATVTPLPITEPRWIVWLRRRSLFLAPRDVPQLCRYRRG